jgi:hypothetical protein
MWIVPQKINTGAPPVAPPSVTHADELSRLNPSINDKVRMGQEAMARKRRAWPDWLAIGEALQVGRAEVMRDTHTNQPTGRRYEKAMAEWLIANGFKEIDKGVRSRLLECLQHRAEIDQWLSGLTDGERFRFNHPDTVLKRWKGSTIVRDPNATTKPSPYAQLQAAHAQLIEENHRLQQRVEAADGDLWKPADTAADIAHVMVTKLTPWKAERTAREILRKLKERRGITPIPNASMPPSVEAGRVPEATGFDANFNFTSQSRGT